MFTITINYISIIVDQIRVMRRTPGGAHCSVLSVHRPGQRKCELGLIF